VPYPITKWWLTSNNINVFNNQFKGVVEGYQVNKRLTSYMANTYNSFKLPKGWTVELSAFYNSKMVWATFLIDPQYSVSAGIAKSFFNDRMSMRVNINDIFKTEETTAKVKYDKIDFNFHQLQDTQFVRFHLTYNFGKRTVEQARRRNSGAQDEKDRVRTGK
jgi:Outer membrane protein beta-barrel family